MNRQKGRTYQVTLLKSPDRSIGLGDATRRGTRIQSFSLAEALTHSYVWISSSLFPTPFFKKKEL